MTQPSDSRAAIQELLGGGPIAYYRVFAAVGGGVTSGVLLSQLYYWHDKTRDPDGWIFKTQDQWQQETGLTRREQETARRNLRERGLIDEKLAGIPARLHYRLNVDRLVALLAEHRRQRLAAQDGAREQAPAPAAGADQARTNPPDEHGANRQTSSAESGHQACTDAPDKLARTRQASVASSAKQACTDPPHKPARTRQPSMVESAKQARRKPPDKPARTRQPSMAESARQARRRPPDKDGGIRQASPAESADHTKTTRDYGTESRREHRTDCGTEHGTEYRTQHPKEHSQRAQKAAASPMHAFCSLHEKPMHQRQKDGDTWYSHRLPNGTWCRGAPGDQPGDAGAPGRERRRRYATQFAASGFRLGAYAPDGDDERAAGQPDGDDPGEDPPPPCPRQAQPPEPTTERRAPPEPCRRQVEAREPVPGAPGALHVADAPTQAPGPAPGARHRRAAAEPPRAGSPAVKAPRPAASSGPADHADPARSPASAGTASHSKSAGAATESDEDRGARPPTKPRGVQGCGPLKREGGPDPARGPPVAR